MGLVSELRRRNVFRVAFAYIIVAWLILQVGDTLAPALRLPDWVNSAVAFFLILGFPLALFFAWAFELTPEGIKLEKQVDRSKSVTHLTGRKLDYVIIAVLATAVALFAFDEWVVEPARDDPATQASAEAKAEQEAGPDQASGPGRGGATARSIAVLPFANLSPDPEHEYFADGLSDVLMHALAQLDDVNVISRKSASAFKQQNRDIREVAELLGADAIVEGSVQRLDDRLRITVQLIDSRSGTNVRSAQYDFNDSDLFAIQDNLSRDIVAAVAQSLSGTEAPVSLMPMVSDRALDYHLRGMTNLRRSSVESLELAEQQFKAAIELDAGNIESRHALSDTYNAMIRLGMISYRDMSARKVEIANEILEQDPDSLRALVDVAWLDFAVNFPTGSGIAQGYFERAIELPMKHPGTAYEIAYYLNWNDRPEEAMKVLEQALELDPLAQDLLYSAALLGDPWYADRLISIYPDSAMGFSAAADLYASRGDWAAAFTMWSLAAAKDPDNPEYPASQALVLFEVGLVDEAEAAVTRARELAPNSTMTRVAEMVSSWVQGDKDRAGELALTALDEKRYPVGPAHFFWFYMARDYALRSGESSKVLEVSNRWQHDAVYKGTQPLDPDYVRNPAVSTYIDYWNRLNMIPVLRANGENELADEMLINARRFFNNASIRFQKSETEFELDLFAGNNEGAIDSLDRLLDRWIDPESTYLDINRANFWSLRLAGVHTLPLRDDPRFQAVKDRYSQHLDVHRSRIQAQLQ